MRVTNNISDSLSGNTVPVSKILEIDIKPGWKSGTKVTFNNEDGKICFIIKERSHKYFTRLGNDILWKCSLTKLQTEKGVNLVIPLLDSNNIRVPVKNEMIYNGKRKVVKNKGMPIKNTNKQGDLIIEFSIKQESYNNSRSK